MKWVPGFFAGVSGRSVKLTSGAEVKNEWSYTSFLPYAFVAWAGTTLSFTADVRSSGVCFPEAGVIWECCHVETVAIFQRISLGQRHRGINTFVIIFAVCRIKYE
jgi:hypothetical protein